MPRSPSGASARRSPRVLIKSLERNALHTSRIRDMVRLNGNRSRLTIRRRICFLSLAEPRSLRACHCKKSTCSTLCRLAFTDLLLVEQLRSKEHRGQGANQRERAFSGEIFEPELRIVRADALK